MKQVNPYLRKMTAGHFYRLRVWAACWANAGQASLRKAPLKAKLALLNRATLPIADMHFVHWPFTITRAEKLDKIQRQMFATVERLKPNLGDTPEAYGRRRRKRAATLQEKMGKWSDRWAKRVVRWDQHLKRASSNSFPSQLIRIRSAPELQQRRWIWTRPRCRATPGPVNARFSECIDIANAHLK